MGVCGLLGRGCDCQSPQLRLLRAECLVTVPPSSLVTVNISLSPSSCCASGAPLLPLLWSTPSLVSSYCGLFEHGNVVFPTSGSLILLPPQLHLTSGAGPASISL